MASLPFPKNDPGTAQTLLRGIVWYTLGKSLTTRVTTKWYKINLIFFTKLATRDLPNADFGPRFGNRRMGVPNIPSFPFELLSSTFCTAEGPQNHLKSSHFTHSSLILSNWQLTFWLDKGFLTHPVCWKCLESYLLPWNKFWTCSSSRALAWSWLRWQPNSFWMAILSSLSRAKGLFSGLFLFFLLFITVFCLQNEKKSGLKCCCTHYHSCLESNDFLGCSLTKLTAFLGHLLVKDGSWSQEKSLRVAYCTLFYN